MACPLLLVLCSLSPAQDLRKLKSPDGQIELSLFIAPQEDIQLFRLAWQVNRGNDPILLPAFLGLNIRDEEPILGENVGLIAEKATYTPSYNALEADYMQNGSTGRGLNIEARVYNDGVAFRYAIPASALLEGRIEVDADLSEFRPAGLNAAKRTPLPFILKQQSRWIEITESAPALLTPLNGATLIGAARYTGVTPLLTPWHIVAIATDRARLSQTEILREFMPQRH